MTPDELKPRLSDMLSGLAGMALNVVGCSLYTAGTFVDARHGPGGWIFGLMFFGFLVLAAGFVVGILGICEDERKVASVLTVIVSAVLLLSIILAPAFVRAR
jgi:hypothetical protein